jgi:hypothetical protein
MTQSDLFEQLSPLDQKFWDFHHDNPQVYEHLVKMSRDLKNQGHKKIGIKMLFEVIRWQTMLRTTDPMYKLNNSYASRYAREIMLNEPDLNNIFEVRRIHS